MIEQIKNLRVTIDSLTQLANSLDLSKEVQKSVDSLYLAKAWLGKVLQELGTQTPYKSGYKTKEDIEPTADTAKQDVPTPFDGTMNHIEKVDWLRQEINKLINTIKSKELDNKLMNEEFIIARTNTYNYLCEARFWLGFELARIKKED